MKSAPPISRKIKHLYIMGAFFPLLFFILEFNAAILFTEDSSSESRLAITAPYHFGQFQQGAKGTLKIDPLLSVYDDYDQLPTLIKPRITRDWQGSQTFFIDDDLEYNVFALRTQIKNEEKILYAIENIGALEMSIINYAAMHLAVFLLSIGLFFIVAYFMLRATRSIADPFIELAHQLEQGKLADFSELSASKETSHELILTLTAINNYRSRIAEHLHREKSFTRYISHELRTPMTVIKGCLSLLKLQKNEKVDLQCLRINNALGDMEQLTKTFLLLARQQETESSSVVINHNLLEKISQPLQPSAVANRVNLSTELTNDFELMTECLLFTVLIQNLLANAINCSTNGHVALFVSENGIKVIDDGLGLDSKPRGYEGFGIGLQIVEDICQRYQWHFSIKNNDSAGCTAEVIF